MTKTSKLSFVAVILCVIVGYSWADILSFLDQRWCYKCQGELFRKWVGKDARLVELEFGKADRKYPKDDHTMAKQYPYSSDGKAVQCWSYDSPAMEFWIRFDDNKVIEACNESHFHLSENIIWD